MDVLVATPTADQQHGSRSASARALRRLRRNRLGMSALVVIGLLLLAGVGAGILAPYPPAQTHFDAVLQIPGTVGYALGTDELGRDLLSRVLHGLSASVLVAGGSLLVAMLVGIPLGMLSGLFRAADAVISRFTELLLALPFLLLAVGIAAISGPSLWIAALAIGISSIPTVIRVMRVETMRVTSLDYVTAAYVQGSGHLRVLWHYVLPNSASALIVQVTVLFPAAILSEAMLSFLGLGIQPPAPSLGRMLSDAQSYAGTAPWLAIIPGVVIAVLCVAFNVFGDALRDALDVRASRAS